MPTRPGGRVGRVYRRTPLRVKLVAAVLLLVTVALVGSGIAARATMDSYLVGRLDTQLTSAAEPLAEQRGHDGGGRGGHGGDGLPSAYVVEETTSDGAVFTGPDHEFVDASLPLPRLPTLTAAESKAAGTQIRTVGAVRGDGEWRVLIEPVTLSDGTAGTLLVAQSMSDVSSTVTRLTLLLSIIGAAALVIIAGVGYLVVRASLRPLRVVEHTAAQIAAGDLRHRVPDSDQRTEVGRLAGALNTMLGRIETAFAERAASEAAARSSEERMRVSEAAARSSERRMRAFVADASHELRTPLTTIRGFAELYRQGAADGPEQIARLMGRIEGEATRMGVLVEDLLLLARLDQQRPLARELVDLLAIANDAVHDARAVAPERRIALVVGRTDPPPVVVGDDARLRQVLGNLVSNALRHTPAGTPVTVSVGTDVEPATGRARALLTVADEGPGLPPDATGRVFERFYRVDEARSRDEGGTGLGLAIAAALVTGHDGTIDVVSEPGAGATFRVVLPLADDTASPDSGGR